MSVNMKPPSPECNNNEIKEEGEKKLTMPGLVNPWLAQGSPATALYRDWLPAQYYYYYYQYCCSQVYGRIRALGGEWVLGHIVLHLV